MSWIWFQAVAHLRNRVSAFRALLQDYPAFRRALALGTLIAIVVGDAILTALGM